MKGKMDEIKNSKVIRKIDCADDNKTSTEGRNQSRMADACLALRYENSSNKKTLKRAWRFF